MGESYRIAAPVGNPGGDRRTMQQHVVLCGLGRVGRRVLEYLRAANLPVVVVDSRCDAAGICLDNVRLVQGDFRRPEVLAEAGVAAARGVLILSSDDLINISAALTVRHLNPQVRVVMRMFNQNLLTRLDKAVTNVYALSAAALTAPLFALAALTGQALGAFRVEGLPDGRRQVAELTVRDHSPLAGHTLAEAAARHQALVLAHVPAGGTARFLLGVEPEARLRPGDRLVVCGPPPALAALVTQTADEGTPDLLWAGTLRRYGRMTWRWLMEVDLAVKVCGAVLAAVVTVSTLVFHYGVDRQRVAPALFRTISLMATGADMHGDELPTDGLKIFVAALRVTGAVLLAAFTAIVTNYLLRARLGGALEIRRIPDSGHVVLCGLGNIGYRILEELLGYGERVVAIEAARDGRFVTTARRQGVPVLIGDATVRELLRQAHADRARAVIAATDNELVNLEVALLVRELNPRQRVVLRTTDPNLAQMLREAADVRLALSVSALAAPAFAAALFGDRVQAVFLVEGRLLAVVDLLIHAADPCLAGQTVRAAAVDYNLLPVAVLPPEQGTPPAGRGGRLAGGDRLIAVIALNDLQRLLGREAAAKDWAVDVNGFPPPARPWVAQLLRTQCEMLAEEAERALDRLPVCLGNGLTRGQAEDLLALLRRERVSAEARRNSVRA
jgi:Trk K+ transport system NAD-binding subunit